MQDKEFLSIKQFMLHKERETLAEYASLSEKSKGRQRTEEPCSLRTDYQRDRDRIFHCKSFRRLMHKTQVFLSPEGDHYRTRLTHTLEVSQIARTIANGMRLNEDLTEAIALGHDLGHTPFGHAGERALNNIVEGGFKHYVQSVRVAQVLEKNGKGLNLTYEVLDGILNHTTGQEAFTPEGRVVKYADRIAYINHDIDDAVVAHIIKEKDIPTKIRQVLGESKTQRITTCVFSLIKNSEKGQLKMDEEVEENFNKLHSFMFENVYLNPLAKSEEKKVPQVIESLYNYYKNPDKLPEELKVSAEMYGPNATAADLVACMTDRQAIYCYEKLFIPKSWHIGM